MQTTTATNTAAPTLTMQRALEEVRAMYTQPAAARAQLRKGTVREQALRAIVMLDTAQNIRGRFGLDITRSPVEVLNAIRVERARIAIAVEPIAAVIVDARREGLSYGEAWNLANTTELAVLGFGPGDSDLIAATLRAVGAYDLSEGL